MSENAGFIDEEEGRRRLAVAYMARLKCECCGKVLVAVELPEGDGACRCGRTYYRDSRLGVGWIEPRPDRGGGVG